MQVEGFTSKKKGYSFGARPKRTQPTAPNRHQRRAEAAKAPRAVREAIIANRFSAMLRHQIYVNHPFHYLDIEAVAKMKWTEEELQAACKTIKNALRRRRQGRTK